MAAGPAGPLDKGFLNDAQRALRRQAHQTLAKVTDDIGRRRTFNTAIASVMELLNTVAKHTQRSAQDRSVIQEALDIAVLALSPIVPHVTHALWRELGHTTALIDEPWMMVDDMLPALVLMEKAKSADDGAAREAALADPNVQKFVGAAAVRKVIVVPGKLVNVVV